MTLATLLYTHHPNQRPGKLPALRSSPRSARQAAPLHPASPAHVALAAHVARRAAKAVRR